MVGIAKNLQRCFKLTPTLTWLLCGALLHALIFPPWLDCTPLPSYCCECSLGVAAVGSLSGYRGRKATEEEGSESLLGHIPNLETVSPFAVFWLSSWNSSHGFKEHSDSLFQGNIDFCLFVFKEKINVLICLVIIWFFFDGENMYLHNSRSQ